ncbi:hypothetical protein VNO80_30052 [Phaseolus coccineus]|uniref:Uncharacterized protein n=1 Tax=Phaseolus coccineus TaxID=3886 RepID=A0AAN9QFF8_PHACN
MSERRNYDGGGGCCRPSPAAKSCHPYFIPDINVQAPFNVGISNFFPLPLINKTLHNLITSQIWKLNIKNFKNYNDNETEA